MLPFVAVFFLFLVFSYVIYKSIGKRAVSMTKTEVLFAFGAKVLGSCLYGYIFLRYYGGDDTWQLHLNSLRESEMLLNDPYRFFSEFGPATAIKKGDNFVQVVGFYLNDLEYCLQAKTLAIINIISRGNYYINTVFWNFVFFWGHYWLFQLLVTEFPSRRNLYLLLIFFFPPTVFWLSGIRADAMLFLSFALCVLYFNRWLLGGRLSNFLISLLGFAGVLIFRSPVAALLIPALLGWWLARQLRVKPVLAFISVYLLSAMVFFGSSFITSYDLPSIVAQRQLEFLQLKGSSFRLDTLHPTLKSFALVLPQAVVNTFTRPYPWEASGLLQGMAAADIVFFWGLLVLALFYRDRKWKSALCQPLILCLVFWSTSLYIFIGYTIPFAGAIVRYKIIAELCLLSAFVAMLRPLPGTRIKLKFNMNP